MESWEEVWALLEKYQEPEYTYFIGTLGGEEVKIGRSISPGSRLKQLQTGYPEKLYLYGFIPHTSPNTEKELHKRFKQFHKQGEWFQYSPEIRDFLREIKKGLIGKDTT